MLRWMSLLLLSPAFVSLAMAGATHPGTGEKLAAQQIFRYDIGAEPPSIDPQVVEDVSGNEIANDLFETLVLLDANGNVIPGAATHWESNADRNLYTFHLRQQAKWSNGDPVTAHDFVYAWRRSVDPALASPQAGYMALMSVKNADAVQRGKLPLKALGVRALDDYTLQVELDDSIAYFPRMLIAATTAPVNRRVIEQWGDDWTRPGHMVGNGAYVLTEHKLNERLVRERNPLYWDNENTHIDKVVALVIGDQNQAYNRYQAGELDKTNVPTGLFRRLKKERPTETHSDPLLCSYYFYVNVKKPPLDDVRVRQALAYAIDRDIITRNILQAGQIPAYSFTPGATADFSVPDVPFARMSQKQRDQKARQLLESAGFNRSHPLTVSILYNTSEGHKKIAIAISQMWKQKLGVKIKLENQEWKTFLSTRKQGDFEIARSGWCGYYNEPSAFLNLLAADSEYNDSNYHNARIDALLKQAKKTSQPAPLYQQIEQIIAQDFPIIPIYHYTSVILLKPDIRGWPFENVQNIWYSKNLYRIAQ